MKKRNLVLVAIALCNTILAMTDECPQDNVSVKSNASGRYAHIFMLDIVPKGVPPKLDAFKIPQTIYEIAEAAKDIIIEEDFTCCNSVRREIFGTGFVLENITKDKTSRLHVNDGSFKISDTFIAIERALRAAIPTEVFGKEYGLSGYRVIDGTIKATFQQIKDSNRTCLATFSNHGLELVHQSREPAFSIGAFLPGSSYLETLIKQKI